MRKNLRNSRGFNLVEMLVAMGLLGTVLLSVVTLFYFGRGNVYAGKQLTLANSVANSVLEDLAPLTLAQTSAAMNFTLGGATPTPLVTNTVNGRNYDNSIRRTTDTVSGDNNPNFLDRWQGMLRGASGVWLATTYYALDVVIAPPTPNGFLYRATAAGTSGNTVPSWPTAEGATVVDGGVTWRAIRSVTGSLPNSAVDVIFTPDLANRLLRVRVIVSWHQEGKGSFGSQRREVVAETIKVRPN